MAKIVELPEQTFACMRHVGPYPGIGAKFEALCAWAYPKGIVRGNPIGIFWDDPCKVPEAELRSDACVPVDSGFVSDHPEVTVLVASGGRYAMGTHMGPYEGLPDAWNAFMATVDPDQMDMDGWCFEEYMNDCSQVAPEEVHTDMYTRLK
ncbi:MAG: GyrI-like domain-containing protein [Fimbriimonadaceae bacterium]